MSQHTFGAFAQYDESDILDFISGNEIPPIDMVPFGSLEDAEDLDYHNQFAGQYRSRSETQDFHFDHPQQHDDPNYQQNANDSGQSFVQQPTSFLSSNLASSLSTFKQTFPNQVNLTDQHQQQKSNSMISNPVTPLGDHPYTPNAEAPFSPSHNHHNASSSTKSSITSHNKPSLKQNMQSKQQVSSDHHNQNFNGELLELKEFVAPGAHEHSPLFKSVQEVILNMNKQLYELRASQTQLLQDLCTGLEQSLDYSEQIASLNNLLSFQSESIQTVKSTQSELVSFFQSTILPAHEIETFTSLMDELSVIGTTLQLYQEENQHYLNWVTSGSNPPSIANLACLVIVRGSFPSIWMKRNQMSEAESINVKLLTSCTLSVSNFSEVKAFINCHTPYTSKTTPSKPIVEHDMAPLDPEHLTASFQFTFKAGTRKDVAQCRFSVDIEGSSFATKVLVSQGLAPDGNLEGANIISPDSKPFIVITNECQYGESLGILFQKDVFHHQWGEPKNEIPWHFFSNSIQRYFIRALRTSPFNPKRGLSSYDMNHIHHHFFSSTQLVNTKQFSKFWDWYGKVLHRLRYQRHTAALWMEGLISGMVSREGVYAQLISRPPGTFMLRFSESSAGFIAIGYRVHGQNGGIKNYLVKPEDTASANVKTLPDFIRSRPEFAIMLQYAGEHLEDGFPVFYPIHKDDALKAYYSARPHKVTDTKTTGSPYDEL